MSQSPLPRKGGPSSGARREITSEDDITRIPECLHRYFFTCNLISHDGNTCPLLTPAEREIKRKLRAENYANNEQALLPIQDSQPYNSRNPLKRPRSPSNGRQLSPLVTSRSKYLLRNDKRQKSTSSLSIRETRNPGYHSRDHKNSSRQNTRHSDQSREFWSRLEIPNRREDSRGRSYATRDLNRDRYQSRNATRHITPRGRTNSSKEWRPRRSFEAPRNRASENRASENRALRHTSHNHMEKSRATYDSQRTISNVRASLESGEINENENRNTEATSTETEEERIRRIKGKAIITDTPPSRAKKASSIPLAPRNTALTISEKATETPQLCSRHEQSKKALR
ncbi:hypothetical protein Bca4012_065073 [Brassica carinata]